MDCSSTLPDELVLHFFDGCSIAELCRLSRVSLRWRAVARSHPTFWSQASIREWEAVRGGLPCFLERMGRCPEAPIAVEYDFSAAVPEIVWSAVSANLHRTNYLRVSSYVENWPLELLDVPAPQLQRLDMTVVQHPPHLPRPTARSIFAGYAPKLRSVKLADVVFWLDLAPEISFAAVEEVDISFSSVPTLDLSHDMLDRVARLFPQMQSLTIDLFDYSKGQPARRFCASALSAGATDTFAHLQRLVLHHSPACSATLCRLPLSDIPLVELSNNIFGEPGTISSLLPTTDYCATYDRDDTVRPGVGRLVLWTPDGRVRRTLSAVDAQSLRTCADTMRASVSDTRLVCLSLDSASAWQTLLAAVDVLPALRTLRLVVIPNEDWRDGAGSTDCVRCPALRTWVLDAHLPDSGTVALHWPRSLANSCFERITFSATPATLLLHGLILTGDNALTSGPAQRTKFGKQTIVDSADSEWFMKYVAVL